MDYDHEQQAFNFISGLLLGVVIGAGIALLMAPQPGRKTRKKLRKTAVGIRENATDRLDDFADGVRGRVDEVIKSARGRFAG